MTKFFNRAALGSLALVPMFANAAVDTTAIAGAGTDIAAVGVAVFAVIVGIKLVKWIRRAL
ncbi:MAG TPA: major capsid protein [Pseudoxanthomonas sp.]|nr:major capsid protein [Pseudoxanthomonas sp.]